MSPTCPFPSSLSPSAGWAPAGAAREATGFSLQGRLVMAKRSMVPAPVATGESRALPACPGSRMQKSHVPHWGQNSGVRSDRFCISPARRLEGKSWKITKSPYHHTGAPQSHRNDKLGLSILSQGLCVWQDGEAKGCCSLKALNCSIP